MKKLLAVLTLSALAVSTHAAVIDFDDLIAQGTYGPASGSGFVDYGFQFSSNVDAVDVSSTGGWWSTGANGGHSGKFAALNNYGGVLSMTKVGGGTFSVQDLWLNGWQGNSVNGSVSGYLGGNLVSTVNVSFSSPWQQSVLNFAGIDQLTVSGDNLFLVDDIRVDSASVSEPASLLMMGLGLLGLGFARKRAVK